MRLFVLSYLTLAGSGTGDLTPSTGFASMAVALEAMMGQIYPKVGQFFGEISQQVYLPGE
jgi:hypothetical protein